MYDGGSTTSNANGLSFGNQNYLDQPYEYSLAFNIILTTGGAQSFICGKRASGDVTGYHLLTSTGNFLFVAHGNSGSLFTSNNTSIALSVGTRASVLLSYSYLSAFGRLRIWINGQLALYQAGFARPVTNARAFTVGTDELGSAAGVAAKIGHLMFWPFEFGQREALEYHNGLRVPAASALRLWCMTVNGQKERINGLSATVIGAGAEVTNETDHYFWNTGEITAAQMARHVGSARLAATAWPLQSVPVRVGLEGLNPPLLGRVRMASVSGPASDGLGWLPEKWRHRPGIVVGREVDYGNDTVRLDVVDMLRQHGQVYAPLTNPKGSRSYDAVAHFPRKARVRFTRSSLAFFRDESGIINRILRNVPRITNKGLLIEGRVKNQLITSSFNLGTTSDSANSSWIRQGHGTNGSSVTLDNTLGCAGPDIAGSALTSLKVVAGNPLGGTAAGCNQVVTTPANAESIITVIHQDLAASGPTSVKIQRSSDSQYLTGDNTWSATETWHALAASVGAFGAGSSPRFTPSGAENITLTIASRTTAGQTNWYGHAMFAPVRIEVEPVATPIPANTYEKLEDQAWMDNGPDWRIFPKEQGTALLYFEPLWTGVWSEDRTLFHCAHDGSNEARIFIRVSDGALVFRMRVGGSNSDAVLSGISWTRFSRVRIGARWTGTNGELGLSNFTYSIFGGTTTMSKGTDVVGSAALTESNTSVVWLGSNGGATEICWGYVRPIKITPYVLPDDVIRGILKAS